MKAHFLLIIDLAKSGELNNQNIKLNRIDIWVAPLSFKNRYKKKGGLGEDELRVGATVVMLHEYFAASKTLDEKTI